MRFHSLCRGAAKRCINLEKAMPDASKILKNAVYAATRTLQSIGQLEAQIAQAADLITNCLRAGKQIARLREWGQRG